MRLIDCDSSHAPAIRQIFNEVIKNSAALYEYQERSHDRALQWIKEKEEKKLPIIGLLSEDRELAGFASYGPFRHFPAFKYTAEHSLYIKEKFRGQKLGLKLLDEICQKADQDGIRTLIGAIDSQNEASLNLHKKAGFHECGMIKDAGFKFGKWLDLIFVQKSLNGPKNPVDG